MRRAFPVFCVIVAVSGSSAVAAASPARPVDTMACLQAHKALINAGTFQAIQGTAKVPALGVNFALVPKLALNSATLAFEKSAVSAKSISDRYATLKVKQLRKAGLKVTLAGVRQTLFVQNNVIIFWNHDIGVVPAGQATAARIIQGCIS